MNNAAILGLIASAMTMVVSIFSVIEYKRQKISSSFQLTLLLLVIFSAILLETHFYLFGYQIFLYLLIFAYVFCSYIVILFVDSITREQPDPLKIVVCTLLSGFVLRDLFTKPVFYSDVKVWHFQNSFIYLFEILQLYSGVLILIYISRIFIKSPDNLKKSAATILFGLIMFTLISSLLTVLERDTIFTGLHLLTESIGLFIVAIGWYRNPKLAFILPFKAIRLNIIDGKSGIPLYHYVWDKKSDIQDEMLYSGMLQGISLIVKESINRGEVQEIKLEKGVLLVQREQVNKTIAVLLSSRSSKYLRECLQTFLIRFCYRFQEELTQPTIVENFLPAHEIVEDVFHFLPN